MNAFNCTSCNSPNASNARFCVNCGASLSAESATPYQTPSSQSGAALISNFAFAGFWKRFVAYIIDTFIYAGGFVLILLLLGGSLLTLAPNNPEGFFAAFGIYFAYYPGWWLYFALMESSSLQATFGKKLMGIKVTNINGQPVGFGQATGRHFSAFITQLTFSIGYLMAAFTARKQALHDMVAGTLVVNARYEPNQIKVASDNPGSGMSVGAILAIVFLVLLIPIGGILAAIAIPAYQDYTIRAKVHQAIEETTHVQNSITEHASKTGYWPNTLQRAGIDGEKLITEKYHVVIANEGAYHLIFKKPELIADTRIVFTPRLSKSGDYEWHCEGIDIKNALLPPKCRSTKNNR